MHRHGVVMGPQAVCSVTAELSRPEGRQWVSGGSWTAGFKNPRSCKSQNPKSHFQSTTLKVQVQVQSCKFKTGLTSPHPQSPRQTQTGCWRQLTHGRRLGFVPTRRGGKFDWLRQGSSWAESLRGNHSIQFKLEKQFVSEAKSFLCQDSQAVLAVPREGTSF